METPAYFTISPLTGYAMFIFRNVKDRGKETLYNFSLDSPIVACLDRPNASDVYMVCRILNYSMRDSYRKTLEDVQDFIKNATGYNPELLPEAFISLTYSAESPFYTNAEPESYLPF